MCLFVLDMLVERCLVNRFGVNTGYLLNLSFLYGFDKGRVYRTEAIGM